GAPRTCGARTGGDGRRRWLCRAGEVLMRALIAAVLATGCSSILGIGDVTLTGDAAPDGPPVAPPNTVIGRTFNNCLTATGMTQVPSDNSAIIFSALIPDAGQASGYRTVTGSGKADGTFQIDNVPDGMEYILHIGRSYFVTKSHSIDQHFNTAGRCDTQF